jgi:hypothetical protein
MYPHRKNLLLALLLCAAALPSAGCEPIVNVVTKSYTGPLPQKVDLVAETVIIRQISNDESNRIQRMYVDRERYLKSEPHSIDRVVRVLTHEVLDVVIPLNLKVGDRIRISTRSQGYTESGDLARFVPDWPYDKYNEYLLGEHVLTAVEKIAR